MKKEILIFCLLLCTLLNYAQSNSDIARVYIKRANEVIEGAEDYKTALTYFKKAMKYTDSIINRDVAFLGSKIYFETHQKQLDLYEQLNYLLLSEKYSKQYFVLAKDRDSEEYLNCVEDYVLIQETKEKLLDAIKEFEVEELRKKIEFKKIDSLTSAWKKKSESLTIKVDTIHDFNKNKLALFTNNGFFGLINDVGEFVVEANQFLDVIHFDGYFIFKNQKENPTKLYCYNSNKNVGFEIPEISLFSSLSTHFGRVMLPRGNGLFVTYPDKSNQPFVYDLNERKLMEFKMDKEFFKNLKKTDKIDKYNKDGEVKINKKWYTFGGDLGGEIHPLYQEKGTALLGFLCAVDGTVINTASDYQYIGAFYNGTFEASKSGVTIWIDQKGKEVGKVNNEAKIYSGNSIIERLNKGSYHIKKDGFIILGKEKLEKMDVFIKKN